jgi:2-aminoadipate transaminase
MIYEASRRGVLERQLPILRRHYAHKRDVMEAALRREMGTAAWPRPKGGFFLWVSLPHGIDAGKMIQRAIEHGVIYVSGDAFYVNGEGQTMLRLSFSAPTPERIDTGVARLAATIRAETAALETAAAAAGRGAP